MESYKSLSVAACRLQDPEALERIRFGLDTQTWGTLLAMFACICGPLLYADNLPFEVVGFVVAITLGIISSSSVFRARKGHSQRVDASRLAATAMGSGAIVIPAIILRMSTPGQHLQIAAVATLLVGAVFWFIGESSKLHMLEEWSMHIASSEVRKRARNLRWGVYAALITIAAALAPAAIGGLSNSNYLTIQFMLTVCVAMLVFTLMGAMLQGRLSVAIKQQLGMARTVRPIPKASSPRELPDEPNWVVWPHPPRWSSF